MKRGATSGATELREEGFELDCAQRDNVAKHRRQLLQIGQHLQIRPDSLDLPHPRFGADHKAKETKSASIQRVSHHVFRRTAEDNLNREKATRVFIGGTAAENVSKAPWQQV